jgi:hypothetical protein
MAEKAQSGSKKKKTAEIKFRCQLCNQMNRLEDMRTITRFVPMLVVCKNCEREMR